MGLIWPSGLPWGRVVHEAPAAYFGPNTYALVLSARRFRAASADALRSLYDRGGVMLEFGVNLPEVREKLERPAFPRGAVDTPPSTPGYIAFSIVSRDCSVARSWDWAVPEALSRSTSFYAAELAIAEEFAGAAFNRPCFRLRPVPPFVPLRSQEPE